MTGKFGVLLKSFPSVLLVAAVLLAGPNRIGRLIASESFAVTASRNLIVNGDLERDDDRKPPFGWVMWGAQQFKNPENYTRDTQIRRSGKASLRIFHPKDTAGYIVTDPQLAIRPEPGLAYDISFFARADRPCQGRFMVIGYESIRPFVDAESPLNVAISLDTQWRQYRFEIRESMDFFAESSRYLILGFQAAGDSRVECTMWVDDVVVIPRKMPAGARLINPATLSIPPLPHRLTPGDTLDVTADVLQSGRPTLKTACGLSFHRLVGFTGFPFDAKGQYNLPGELEMAIRELKLPLSRVYGVGHEPPQKDQPPWSIEMAIDRLALLCRRINLPYEMMVVELEEQSARRKLPPEVWAEAVRYARSKGYGFRYWEVSNEPYSRSLSDSPGEGEAFPTSDDYVAHVRVVSAAIRRADPTAQVGVAIHIGRPRWGNYVLKNAAGSYDFAVAHYYGFENAYKSSFEELVLGQNYRILHRIQQTQALLNAYNPNRRVFQLDTEWGMHSPGPNGERPDYANRNGNIIGVLHRAVRMIYYVREQPLAGASGWQMLGNSRGLGFDILVTDRPSARTMLYWLYYHFIRHVGDSVVDFQGTAPFVTTRGITSDQQCEGPMTPLLLTMDAQKRQLFCVLANGSWTREVPCRLFFKNFQGRLAFAKLLSDDDLDRSPLLTASQSFVRDIPENWKVEIGNGATQVRGTLPAHSVVFLTLEQSP
ncbi:hypothetical protein [Thermogutta sp.]|uniref:hypothetical protein n=1 Tax=Thermogutta sp. TaxID=1962930 RepID=UPI003220994B